MVRKTTLSSVAICRMRAARPSTGMTGSTDDKGEPIGNVVVVVVVEGVEVVVVLAVGVFTVVAVIFSAAVVTGDFSSAAQAVIIAIPTMSAQILIPTLL